ncbi:hypothetical protein FPD46_07895 [Campylobacter peloridis]|uniref:Helicase ATP-binding domain-containing protein n=1 Tax=Campylobacter peloridis TaxID=488546 RepID=A0A5C7DJF7_9BACT|nr:SNF2-related protein [Campylobacter peloridis]TXE78490.1 hypothetical protein FPD46_07895 [Campylobacter peloridis]
MNILFLFQEDKIKLKSSFGTIISFEEDDFMEYLSELSKENPDNLKYIIKKFISEQISIGEILLTTKAEEFNFNNIDDNELNDYLIDKNIEIYFIFKDNELKIYNKHENNINLNDYLNNINKKENFDGFASDFTKKRFNNKYRNNENTKENEKREHNIRSSNIGNINFTLSKKNNKQDRENFDSDNEYKTNNTNKDKKNYGKENNKEKRTINSKEDSDSNRRIGSEASDEPKYFDRKNEKFTEKEDGDNKKDTNKNNTFSESIEYNRNDKRDERKSIISRINNLLYAKTTTRNIKSFNRELFNFIRKESKQNIEQDERRISDSNSKQNEFNSGKSRIRNDFFGENEEKFESNFGDIKSNKNINYELEEQFRILDREQYIGNEKNNNKRENEENKYNFLESASTGNIGEKDNSNYKDNSNDFSNQKRDNTDNFNQNQNDTNRENFQGTSIESNNKTIVQNGNEFENEIRNIKNESIVINGILENEIREENSTNQINREKFNFKGHEEYNEDEFKGNSTILQNNTIEKKFKTFKKYHFLKKMDGEVYKGRYSEEQNLEKRIQDNIEAIKITQKIFSENRLLANDSEKEVLAKYTGFGGLKDLFYDLKYQKYYLELEKLLDKELFEDLKNFSYNAYYTPEYIIENIFDGLNSLGVSKNNKIKALEPSCGIGKFFSLAPENYEFEGIEKDVITATIAKFLHPNIKIYNEAFESIDFYQKEYDVIVGNPPYDSIKIQDIGSFGGNFSIHNYFCLKSAELLKDNGILGFIITNYFLDSIENKHRFLLNELGDFISAFRMPNNTFKNTNANVLTDIFFYQRKQDKQNKKRQKKEIYSFSDKFLESELFDFNNPESPYANSYFINHTDHVFGKIEIKTNQFGNYVMHVKSEDYNYKEKIKEKMYSLHKHIFKENPPRENKHLVIDYDSLEPEKIKNILELKNGNIFNIDNKIYIKKALDLCEEVFFEDKLPIEKKFLIEEQNIINVGKSLFTYKAYLNEKEVEIAKKIIKYRDTIIKNGNNEKNFPSYDNFTNEILKEKEEIRELRYEILNLSGNKFLNSSKNNIRDKNGVIKEHRLKDIIELDKISSALILSTENKIEGTKNYKVSNFLYERIIYPQKKVLAQNPEEALQKTLTDKGYIDLETLQYYLPNNSLDEILHNLTEKRLIFNVLPSERKKYRGEYILADEFLSGNVKEKYKEIENMIKNNINFENVSIKLEEMLIELKNVFPEDIHFEDIEINFGSNYIELDIYEDFIKETFFNDPENAIVKIYYMDGAFVIEDFKILREKYDEKNNNIVLREMDIRENDLNEEALRLLVFNEKNVLYYDLKKLIERILNGKSLEVFHYDPHPENPKKKIKVHESIPTKIALENAEIIKDYFNSYCFNNKEKRNRIERKYNELINTFNQNQHSFSKFLVTPELNKNIQLREHQKNAIFKGILKNSMLLEHEVGAGKTLAGIALIMEQVRMGIIKKALVLVPNHLATQWGQEFLNAYPNANILIGDRIETRKDRKEFLYRIKYGDYNAVIMKHSTFENLNVMESFQTSTILDYIQDLNDYYKNIIKNQNNKEQKKLKQMIDRKINILESKLEKRAIGKKYDEEIAFEDLGIDALIVDEAHNFKNLYINTNQNDIKGLPLNDSYKAMKMFCATKYCHDNNYKLYFLTGTPVSNSIAEFYIMQKFLQPDVLKKLNVSHFDSWQKNFTKITYNEELDSSGVNYKIVARLSKFINIPELMSAYRQNVDIVTNEDIEKQTGRLVPKIKNNSVINVISSRSYNIERFIGIENEFGQFNKGSIIYRMDNLQENPRENNMLKCTSDAKKASLDFRLIDNNSEDYEDSKVNKMIENVMLHYNDKKYPLSTQLIFCDMGVSKENSQKIDIDSTCNTIKYYSFEDMIQDLNLTLIENENEEEESYYAHVEIDENGKEKILKKYQIEELMELLGDKFDLYADILKKLVNKGIPQNQIAFIGDATSDLKKQELFDKVNKGEIRILIGSTAKMGAGTNVQKRVVALHELDCPWKPSDLQQRAGRVIRQGNLFFEEDKENFEISHYRYATEQTYDSRMFQINEKKLIPLIQLKRNHIPKNLRQVDSIDAEIANVSEMKAIATGNPFILEKHKIETMLKMEERYFEQYKKNILQRERSLSILEEQKDKITKELKFLNETSCNPDYQKENFDFISFGIKMNKKNKNEEYNKENKAIINQKIREMFTNFKNDNEVEILKIYDLKLIFKSYIGEISNNAFIQGVLKDKNGNEYTPKNMSFKADNGFIFYSYPELDNILIRITNTLAKLNNFANDNNEELKNIESKIFVINKFLSDNSLEKYDRKILLNTLKKDLNNMNEIFKIRNEKRKNGIKLSLEDKEIENLLPKYKNLIDEKGKLILEKTISLKQNNKFKEKVTQEQFNDKNNNIEEYEELKILDIDEELSVEKKVDILCENQENINNFIRAKDILK